MAAQMPPPKVFADLAEAKEAMLKLIMTLNDEKNRKELEELIKAAEGDQVSLQPLLVAATVGRADTSVLRMRQLFPCPLRVPCRQRRCRR